MILIMCLIIKRNIFSIWFVLFCGFSLFPQDVFSSSFDPDKYEQLLNINESLRKEIKLIEAEIKNKKTSIKNLEKDVKKLDEDIDLRRKKYDKCKKQFDVLNEKYKVSLGNIESLQEQIAENATKLDALEDETKKIDEELAQKQTENKKLVGAQAQKALPIINKHKGYLNKQLSEISAVKLNEILKECTEYKTDKEMKKFINKLNSAISIKNKFDEAMKVIGKDVKYNSQNVSGAIKILTDLQKESNLTTAQRSELNNNITILKHYAEKVNLLKQYVVFCEYIREKTVPDSKTYFIENANSRLKRWKNGKDTTLDSKNIDKLKLMLFESKSGISVVQQEFKDIPYLKSCYDKLMIAPHTQQPIEAEIMAL